jgi:hypothetical protein
MNRFLFLLTEANDNLVLSMYSNPFMIRPTLVAYMG